MSLAPMGKDEYDPSDEAVNGPIGAAFNDYVRRELQVRERYSLRTFC
jgi:hypothetical protein